MKLTTPTTTTTTMTFTMTFKRCLTHIGLPVLLAASAACGNSDDTETPAMDSTTSETGMSDATSSPDSEGGESDSADNDTLVDGNVNEDAPGVEDAAAANDTSSNDVGGASDTSAATDASGTDATGDPCDGVPRCRVVDGVNCPCSFTDFDPNVLVVAYGPDDLGTLSSRIVLVDGTRSPTVCAMGDAPTQSPVLPASAIYIDLRDDIAGFTECERLTGSIKVVYREFAGGAMVGSMTSVSAGAAAEAFWEKCQIDFEALFPNGNIWTYRLLAPYTRAGTFPENVCTDL